MTNVTVIENTVIVTAAPGVSSDTLSADIATHNALATGVHGVGASTVASAASVAAAISAAQLLTINAQTGTTYQFVAGDYTGNVLVRCTNAAAITLTIPAHATVPNVINVVVGIEAGGAGVVTIAAAGGVTINSLNGLLSLSGQWAQAAAICTAQNVWSLVGALA